MRFVFVVLGVIVLLAGTIFALQGAGYILGSFMSNNPTWIWIGTITAVVGFGLVLFGFRSGHVAKNA
jgi:hypothetical protein